MATSRILRISTISSLATGSCTRASPRISTAGRPNIDVTKGGRGATSNRSTSAPRPRRRGSGRKNSELRVNRPDCKRRRGWVRGVYAGVPAVAAMLSSKATGPRGVWNRSTDQRRFAAGSFLDIDGVLQPPYRDKRGSSMIWRSCAAPWLRGCSAGEGADRAAAVSTSTG